MSADRDRIVQALTAETSELRSDGIRMIMDFLFDQRVRELLDYEEARRITVSALTARNAERVIARHVKAGWARYLAAAANTDDPVGALVPDASRAEIRRIAEQTRVPRAAWARGAVDPVLVRKLLAPVFATVLWSFVRKLSVFGGSGGSSPPPAASSGIAERLSRGVQKGAGKLVDASRSVMGGLGAEMEKRAQATVREFSEVSLNIWRDALKDRLRSDEGRRLVQQIVQEATDHVMRARLADVHADVRDLPVEAIMDIVPPILAHAAHQDFVQGVVQGELAAFLDAEGDRPLRELLSELEIEGAVRSAAERHLDGLARRFLQSAAFSDWLSRVLEQA